MDRNQESRVAGQHGDSTRPCNLIPGPSGEKRRRSRDVGITRKSAGGFFFDDFPFPVRSACPDGRNGSRCLCDRLDVQRNWQGAVMKGATDHQTLVGYFKWAFVLPAVGLAL